MGTAPPIGCLVSVGRPVNLPADDVELELELRGGRLAEVVLAAVEDSDVVSFCWLCVVCWARLLDDVVVRPLVGSLVFWDCRSVVAVSSPPFVAVGRSF